MPVGRMDILLTIQSPTESKNSTTGQLAITWTNWNTTFAEVNPKTFGEAEKNNQVTASDERLFRIRYIPGITPKMRLYDEEMDRYYQIKGIAAEGRKNYLLITAKSLNINAPV